MSRSGDDIYASDGAFDYFSTIIDRPKRELAYWLSPEKVINHSWWLAQMLTIFELILLLEQHEFSSTLRIIGEETKTVQRWREVFLNVWDKDWQDEEPYTTRYAYSDPQYRKQHRPAIIQMFDHMESLASFWADLTSNDKTSLALLSNNHPLPYFSIRYSTNQNNAKVANVEPFIKELIEHIVKDIIYTLSLEKRNEVLLFNVDDEIGVAVDTLAFLCDTYQQSPGFNQGVIRNWRHTTTEIWKRYTEEFPEIWNEANILYQNVMAAFDRLEEVAQKYPPMEW